MRNVLIFLLLSGWLLPCYGGQLEPTPIGLWRNVDDVSGKPRALIRIVEQAGELQGRIENISATG